MNHLVLQVIKTNKNKKQLNYNLAYYKTGCFREQANNMARPMVCQMWSPNHLLDHSGTMSGRYVTTFNLKVVFFQLQDAGPKVVNISKAKQNSWLISENTT